MKNSENKLLLWSGISIILLTTLGQLIRWQLTEAVALYLQDVLVGLWLVVFAVTEREKLRDFLQRLRGLLRWPWPIGFLWIGLGWVMLVVQQETAVPLLRAGLYCARLLAGLSFAGLLSSLWPQQFSRLYTLLLIGFGGLIGIWGLLQYYLLPDTRFLKTFGWDDHYYRLISTLFDPGFTGLILVITIIAVLFLSWQELKLSAAQRWLQWCQVIGLIALTAALLLTYSRASFVAFGVAATWCGWHVWRQNHQWRLGLVALIFAVMLGGLPFLPHPTGEGVDLTRTSTINSRIDTNRMALRQLSSTQWWLGSGLFAGKPAAVNPELPDHAQLPDNILVTLLTGIGLGGLLIWAKIGLLPAFRAVTQSPVWLQAMWLAVLTHSFFNNSLFQPHIWLLLMLWTAHLNLKRELQQEL